MFRISKWISELKIFFLYALKCGVGDDGEAKFHDFERPFERIFYILGIQKSDLDEVAEVLF
jgi:hypothetical protein